MNIFVAKLDFSTTSEDLRSAFEQYGEVSSAKVVDDKFTGKSKGFGFVEMPNDDEANDAIGALNDSEMAGKTIVVKEADPKEENPRRRGSGSRPRIKSYSSSGGAYKGGSSNHSGNSYSRPDNDRGGYGDRNERNDRYNNN